jgi:CheY-like chemotaxis protein
LDVLLVEDSPGDVALTVEALREARVETRLHVVRDGEDALAFLNRSDEYATAPRPDLVLLDLNLPRKSGREVLAEMKADARFRRIPVVILSTSTNEDDVAAAYDLAANCYVAKPVDLDQFISVIQAIDNFWLSFVRLPAE